MQYQPHTPKTVPALAAQASRILEALRTWGHPPVAPKVDAPEEVFPETPSFSATPMRAFSNVLTHAITDVVANTADLQEWAPNEMYALKVVYIDLTGAPDRLVHYINSLQPLTLANAVKSIIEAAPGAAATIYLGNYYGCTIPPDINIVKGHPVERLASFGGSNFKVRFAFDGYPVTRPAAKALPSAPAVPAAPVLADAPAQPELPTLDDTPLPTAPLASTTAPAPLPAVAPLLDANVAKVDASNTPLFHAAPQGPMDVGATPLRVAANDKPLAVAQLRLRSLQCEAVLSLQADNFPYTIGRHANRCGYAIKGQRDAAPAQVLAENEPQGFVSFTSREHLVLESYNGSTREFCVTNNGLNGTFCRRNPMPKRFLLSLEKMAHAEWLKLGGAEGDAVLELRIESV